MINPDSLVRLSDHGILNAARLSGVAAMYAQLPRNQLR